VMMCWPRRSPTTADSVGAVLGDCGEAEGVKRNQSAMTNVSAKTLQIFLPTGEPTPARPTPQPCEPPSPGRASASWRTRPGLPLQEYAVPHGEG
jgi:hypothetical protein